jgi:hypothetical protein
MHSRDPRRLARLTIVFGTLLLLSAGCSMVPEDKATRMERPIPARMRVNPPLQISPAKQPIQRSQTPEEPSMPSTMPPKPVKPPSIEGSGG